MVVMSSVMREFPLMPVSCLESAKFPDHQHMQTLWQLLLTGHVCRY